MNRVFISCIIPMYNAEKVIEECVVSILRQTIDTFEIIIIDDGSVDNSLKVVKSKFSHLDNVSIFTQNNRGVSSARNYGIKLARYPYIYFIDADDTLEADALYQLSNNLSSVDLVICNYNVLVEKKSYNAYPNNIAGSFFVKQIFDDFFKFYDSFLINVNWNKIYKKSIIENFGLRFDEALKMGEDALFNIDYLSHSKTVFFLDKKLYNYYINENQAIGKAYRNYYDMVKVYYIRLRHILVNNNTFINNKENYYNHFMVEIFNSFSHIIRSDLTLLDKKNEIASICNEKMFIEAVHYSSITGLKKQITKIKSSSLILLIYEINKIVKRGK